MDRIAGGTARSLLAVGVAAGVCLGLLRLFWLAGRSSLDAVLTTGPDSAADLLVVGAAAAGGALTAWLGLGVVLAALATLPGAVGRASRTAADRLAPAVVRRGVALLLGSTLAAAAAPAVAHADGGLPVPTLTSTSQTQAPPAPDPAFGATGRTPAVDAPSPQPTGPNVRPATSAAPDPAFTAPATPAPAPAPPAPASPPRVPDLGPLGQAPRPAPTTSTVTVVRGDSLWRIAARHLGTRATNQEIAREWPLWYAANRAVIGPDPDLIHAGQVLTVPTPEGGSS